MEIALVDRTLPTLAENLAFDEALLLEAEAGTGSEALRFWEWPAPAVVLGAGGIRRAEADEERCQRDGVPIQRRASGGGTVLLGAGCLLFSLVLRFERERSLKDVNASYRYILGRMINALRPSANLELLGISDLAVRGQKCSGNAQQRKRDHVLHHGTLLYQFDLDLLARYLRMPDKQPAYRVGRPHDTFVANLAGDREQLSRLIAAEWGATSMRREEPWARTAALVAEKYSLDDWIRRR